MQSCPRRRSSRRFAARRPSLLDDAAVEQVDGAVGVARVARVVGDHADGGAGAVQLAQQVHDRLAVVRVEVAGGLVGEQDRGIADERARHRDALLLAARELAGQVLRAVRHADALERLVTRFSRSAGRHAAVGERQLDVLVHGEIADQVEALEDEPDLAVADARALARRELCDRLAVEHVAARRWASRAGRGSTAASTCRSPRARRSTTYSPLAMSRLTSERACVSTSSV